ncbi:MAG: alpha/beta hydrolase-fold protein [Candidatus Poseidoniaceae archaeon]|nr:alpha/beta hydrolase-fold protein [Candidatus Poseidoniaceae archaeon]
MGDPLEREIVVHIPPNNGGPLPCIIYLAPFTGTGFARANWKAYAETLPQRHERLVKEGSMGPCILVMPDTFTSLGGNQFIDSEIMGKWGTWLREDLQNEIKSRYEIEGFGLVGKSSGGYGALVRGMLDEEWDAVACHSGDCGFELIYGSAFPSVLTNRLQYDGNNEFINSLKNNAENGNADMHSLMIMAMASTYGDGTLPVTDNCIVDEKKWAHWAKWDPLNLIEMYHDLPPTWIDVGNCDQYHIQYGLRQLHAKMNELNIEHEWEEFPGTHSGIDHRLNLSLPWLYSIITSVS